MAPRRKWCVATTYIQTMPLALGHLGFSQSQVMPTFTSPGGQIDMSGASTSKMKILSSPVCGGIGLVRAVQNLLAHNEKVFLQRCLIGLTVTCTYFRYAGVLIWH
mmetsp:Transcript_21521/g.41075  ORF Transcript_21521/g.41075 Transcript_21521/m.41075 type:complete len:105 (+) Transcript_21521:2016-2330(+)